MRLLTRKELSVVYPARIRNAVRRLRVAPPEHRAGQTVIRFRWHCDPLPVSAQEYNDEWGNRVLELRHQHINRRFRLQLDLLTEHLVSDVPRDCGLGSSGLGAYVLPSALCNLTPAVETAALDVLEETRAQPAALRVEALCQWTHDALRYHPDTTTSRTSAGSALALEQGVCQDYAHLMIALCRASGIPARYISGYLLGAGRMHAWVEALCEETWQAWDPTHNRACSLDTVYVACGRDYRDVAPLRGSYLGPPGAKVTAYCETVRKC